MEKEQILSTLKSEHGKNGLSEKTIADVVDAFDFTGDDAAQTATLEKVRGILKSLQGNFNHDISIKVEDFKKNYKPETKPAEEQKPQLEGSLPGAQSGEIAKLMKMVEELKASNDARETREAQSKLLTQVREAMRRHNATDSYVLDKTLQGVTLDAKKSVDELVKEQLARYDAEYKACRGTGAAPRNGDNGNGGGKTANAASSFFKRKSEKEGWNK